MDKEIGDEYQPIFNEDDSAVILSRISPNKLELVNSLEPEDAPLYLDLQKDRGFYTEGYRANQFEEQVEDIYDRLNRNEFPEAEEILSEDYDRWRDGVRGFVSNEYGDIEVGDLDMTEPHDKDRFRR